MSKWYIRVAAQLSKHSDAMAVIRSGRKKAKHRTNKRNRRQAKMLIRRHS